MNERIVLIGLQSPKYNLKGLSEGFEEEGCEVIRIAADMESENNVGTVDYHLLKECISVLPFKPKEEWKSKPKLGYFLSKQQLDMINILQYECVRIPLYPLIKRIELQRGKIDRILVGQSELPLDMSGLEYYYIFTELWKPTIPYGGTILGVFYSFVGGDETFKRSFPYEYNHCEFEPCFVPYGMDFKAIPSQPIPWTDRTIGVGFKGLLAFNDHSRDLRIRHIYDERKKYVQLAEQIMNDPEWKNRQTMRFTYEPHTTWDDYIRFMQDCKVAINLPGSDGWVNQRQYEALGFGCLLLQYEYPELHQLGFKHQENCLLFRDEQSLVEQLIWIDNHPHEAEVIAQRGHNFFISSKCSWQDRAKEIYQIWHKPIPESWKNWKIELRKIELLIRSWAFPSTVDTTTEQYGVEYYN